MTKKPLTRNKKQIIKRNVLAWLLALPTLILFAFFVWYPLIRNIIISFFSDYDLTTFVGFDNYRAIFNDDYFIAAFFNTFKYILWSIIIGFFIPMIVGLLLSEVIHARGFFRVALYIPTMLSGIAVVFLFQNIYGDEAYSILNVIRRSFGLEPTTFRSNADIVIPLIVVAMTWKGFGGTSLIYMANYQNIDTNLYEASRMDGAGPFKRFIKITMPLMKPTILTLFILQIISVFQVFYEPMIIAGRTAKDAMSLMQLSYYYFTEFQDSKSAATSIILALIIIIITIIYFAIVHKVEAKEQVSYEEKK